MINIGGGRFFRRHWKILDVETKHYGFMPGVVDYSHDLISSSPFPFKDNQVTLFYSQHTLEHIPQEFCQHIFDEIHRCLKPGGAVRIMVPDFDLAKKAFLANDLNFDRDWTTGPISTKFLAVFASYYIDKLSLEEIKNKIETMGFEKYADFLTSNIPRESQKDHSGHINWWNFEKLHKMLKNAGFKQIYRSYPQKSKFPEIRGETDVRSSFDHTLWYMSVIVEAIK